VLVLFSEGILMPLAGCPSDHTITISVPKPLAALLRLRRRINEVLREDFGVYDDADAGTFGCINSGDDRQYAKDTLYVAAEDGEIEVHIHITGYQR
jgi:hypothetical protein